MSKKTNRRLTHEQIGMIRGLWEQGAFTASEIAAEIDASLDQVKYQIKKHGWVQGIRADYYERIAQEAIQKELEGKAKDLAVKKEDTRTRAVQMASLIEGRVLKIIKRAEERSLNDSELLNDFKSLECASRILQNTFHVKRFALGMDKEEPQGADESNLIEVLEMTAEEMEEIRNAQERSLSEMDAIDGDLADSEEV